MCRGVKPLYKGKQPSLTHIFSHKVSNWTRAWVQNAAQLTHHGYFIQTVNRYSGAQPFGQRGQFTGGRLSKVLHSFIPQLSGRIRSVVNKISFQWPIRSVFITENINVLAILKENKANSLLPFGSNMGLLGWIYLFGFEKWSPKLLGSYFTPLRSRNMDNIFPIGLLFVCFCFSKAVIIQNVIKEFGLHEKLLSSIAKES